MGAGKKGTGVLNLVSVANRHVGFDGLHHDLAHENLSILDVVLVTDRVDLDAGCSTTAQSLVRDVGAAE